MLQAYQTWAIVVVLSVLLFAGMGLLDVSTVTAPTAPHTQQQAVAIAADPTRAPQFPTSEVLPSPTPAIVPSPTLPTTTSPTLIPTPSPRPAGTPWRVGLQVGHLNSNQLPEELAHLRTSTGARWGDVTEAELNQQIVERVRSLLEDVGVVVDVIPATVPPSYDADAFLAIHADGNSNSAARGWKLATPWRASQASKQLLTAVAASYGPATEMPQDFNGVTVNMRGYYAFSYRRYVHTIARTTPAIIVETGFMTNAADRTIIFDQQERVAFGIAQGIVNYLAQHNPNDGAALLPPEFPTLRGKPGATLRAAPSDDAALVAEVGPDDRIFAFSLENGWYEAFLRGSRARQIGFIREDMVEPVPEEGK